MKTIKATKNFRFLNNSFKDHKINGVVLEGGSRSGKTWAICQFLATYIMKNKGKVLTIGRDKMTHLKRTLFLDWKVVLEDFKLTQISSLDKSEMYYEINSNLIRFVGVNDDIMLAHGLAQDVFWLNEAMSISKDTFDQLEQRTTEFFILDLNPSALNHWIYDLEKRKDIAFFNTTVIDNPFAPEKARAKIFSYEDTPRNREAGTVDKFKWTVYGQGKRGASEEIIYKSWHLYTHETEPKDWDLRIYGLDFGFSNSKTALVDVIITGNNIFLKELLYETGYLNSDIFNFFKENCNLEQYVIADSAEGKSIADLRAMGLSVLGADKGPGSIKTGINKLKEYRIFVHAESENLQFEIGNYKWAKDKKTNLVLNDPVKENDHLLDAVRYAVTKFRL